MFNSLVASSEQPYILSFDFENGYFSVKSTLLPKDERS